MFIERLDDLHTVEERKSEDQGTPTSRSIFPADTDDKGESFDNLRWSRFKHFEARGMMRTVDEHESTLTGVVSCEDGSSAQIVTFAKSSDLAARRALTAAGA
ncbi:MAG: hypothetical protein EpisKO_03910 [Epibacterium sp.]